jgi:hypothetical protein
MREARVVAWIESFGRDLRHGARMFRRRPGPAALAILTLSLGIGANAAIFSLLNAVLLRPLPFPDADRLVAVTDNFRATGAVDVGPTVPELLDVRESIRTLDGISFYDTRDFQLTGGDEPVRVFAARVVASFLTLLGVRPSHGRLFETGEDRPGRDRVVVVGDGLWRRNFGADPAIVSPGYFSVLRIPLRDGRIFADDDIVGRPAVAIGRCACQRSRPSGSIPRRCFARNNNDRNYRAAGKTAMRSPRNDPTQISFPT